MESTEIRARFNEQFKEAYRTLLAANEIPTEIQDLVSKERLFNHHSSAGDTHTYAPGYRSLNSSPARKRDKSPARDVLHRCHTQEGYFKKARDPLGQKLDAVKS